MAFYFTSFGETITIDVHIMWRGSHQQTHNQSLIQPKKVYFLSSGMSGFLYIEVRQHITGNHVFITFPLLLTNFLCILLFYLVLSWIERTLLEKRYFFVYLIHFLFQLLLIHLLPIWLHWNSQVSTLCTNSNKKL